jgi:hypothetical protein
VPAGRGPGRLRELVALCCEAQRCLHRVWRAGRTHSIVSRTESTSTDADKVETQTRYNQQPSEIVGCRSCGVGLAFLCRTTIFFRRRTTHGRSRRASHGSTSYITCDKSLIKATAQQRSSAAAARTTRMRVRSVGQDGVRDAYLAVSPAYLGAAQVAFHQHDFHQHECGAWKQLNQIHFHH